MPSSPPDLILVEMSRTSKTTRSLSRYFGELRLVETLTPAGGGGRRSSGEYTWSPFFLALLPSASFGTQCNVPEAPTGAECRHIVSAAFVTV